ncbi:hypothetical protein SNOG_10124 [Parastagonospora nodorum SN15]|uniref:Uncharacterized protein n=1 Tax=Phaeosphaeria nodorum (strain SN15 / ATCC MYA-4574 / FGSC 10173) TaxID=321614 RepID=Q0UDP0_PHANO|nr:hypothetical protein SNOG_10124 [Parastagonospora nodorum SN15]EAT82459.2 hypothetical protein SNOG_10124 [Parastagonospora nodorum SN15]
MESTFKFSTDLVINNMMEKQLDNFRMASIGCTVKIISKPAALSNVVDPDLSSQRWLAIIKEKLVYVLDKREVLA